MKRIISLILVLSVFAVMASACGNEEITGIWTTEFDEEITGIWKTEFSESNGVHCYTVFNKDGEYENHFVCSDNDIVLNQGYYDYKENSDEVSSGKISIYGNQFNSSSIGRMNEYNGYHIFAVLSDSMSISNNNTSVIDKNGIHFNAGDLIICKELGVDEINNLQAGDIITFQSQNADNFGEVVTHKIRRVTSTAEGYKGYVTYGINTNTDDETIVTPDFIIGKYVGKLPFAIGEKYELSYTLYKKTRELEIWKDSSEKYILKSN